jgi:hypothetical protein
MPDRCLLIPGAGGVAQLGERLLCKQEVIGSNPFTSTTGKAELCQSLSFCWRQVQPSCTERCCRLPRQRVHDARRRLSDTAAGDRGGVD